MTEAQGTVVTIDGPYALIQTKRVVVVAMRRAGCGINSLGKMFCNTPQTYRVLNPGNSCVGDRVGIVVVAKETIRKGVVFVHLMPLSALFAGAFGDYFSDLWRVPVPL